MVAARIPLLCLLAACAAQPSASPAPVAEAPEQTMQQVARSSAEHQFTWWLLTELTELKTADQMRAHLEAGFTKQELRFRGFDDVTLAECIAGLVATALDARQRPGDPAIRSRLEESADLFVAVRKEAIVRRTAGAASCLPPVR